MAQALEAAIPLFDYLAMDDASELRHEYVAGRIYATTGGTMRHNRIAGNVFRVLADRLEGSPCQVFINDMKLHVQAADSVYYPDVFVHCGSALASGDKVVQDATLIVDSMAYGRGEALPLACIDSEPVSLATLYAGTDVA